MASFTASTSKLTALRLTGATSFVLLPFRVALLDLVVPTRAGLRPAVFDYIGGWIDRLVGEGLRSSRAGAAGDVLWPAT